MIETYYKPYSDLYYKTQMAKKRYIEAREDFYTLSGVQYDKVNVMGGKPQEFADILDRVEKLHNDFIKKLNELAKMKEEKWDELLKIEDPISRSIIEYKYLDFKDDVAIIEDLKKYNGKDYSIKTLYNLVTKAKDEWNKVGIGKQKD